MDGVRWTGLSGQTYDFLLHPINSPFMAVGGCYIFTRRNLYGRWDAIYIGQTSDLSARTESVAAMPCVRRRGATHICTYTRGMNSPHRRLDVEQDLLGMNPAPCNQQ